MYSDFCELDFQGKEIEGSNHLLMLVSIRCFQNYPLNNLGKIDWAGEDICLVFWKNTWGAGKDIAMYQRRAPFTCVGAHTIHMSPEKITSANMDPDSEDS